MHQQDFPGDPAGSGSRKPAYHFRRGSGGAPSGDEHPAQPGSSSPALHHQAGQVKKKSGFQITSVTSAQVNVSGNNSLADDTESYDDLDESHTEDLSSSDMLDVSVSKATDTGVPERSSSDETLNSLHGVDTPGLVSPNEPLQHQQHSALVNGTVHQQFYCKATHQRSDSLGGAESSQTLSSAPLASSSPAPTPKANQTHKLPAVDNLKSTNAAVTPVVSEGYGQGSGSTSAVPPSVGSDGAAGQAGSTGQSASTHTTHTQTGSRFRVVKLDTNSEPIRKGRWTCTEYYEKEVPHPAPAEAPKGADAESEGVGLIQPPHTLQPYPLPVQDFTSPQAMQSPPQPPTQTPLTYVSPQELPGGSHLQKPAGATPPAGQCAAYPQAQLQTGGILPPVGARQPDFIQPTAPFQTQVPPPLPLVTPVPVVPLPQSLPIQSQLPAAVPAPYAAPPPQNLPVQTQIQPPTAGAVPVPPAHTAPFMPLTALQADLQPLLTSSISHVALGGSVLKSSQLEDAQKLLFQHQSLLGLPRLGSVAGGEGSADSAVGSLAHIGMSAEASAFMAAAAAGLRSQHAEGEEDSSSGASVVAIDNKIEQAMDLVKSHLMYAVREEVEVLKEQIKELMERNTQLEQENNLLKTLASPEQMAQFQAQVQTGGSPTGAAPPPTGQAPPPTHGSGTSA